MSLYIPRLRRAVSDFLQLPPQDTTIACEIIQESLHDARTVNSVYHLLISQASREPFSPIFVEKSVGFMRRHLSGFPPTSETLTCISRFCVLALKMFGTGAVHERPALQRSLHFLQKLVEQVTADALLLSDSGDITEEGQTSLKPSTLASVRSWELGANGVPESENGELNSLGLGSRMGSTPNLAAAANSIGGASNISLENIPHSVRRTKTPVGTPVTPARRTESGTRAMWLNPTGSTGQGDSQTHRRSRSGSIAEQFVQEMLKFRPPLIWMPNGANRNQMEPEDDSWLSATSMRGLMCAEHLWTVADKQTGANSVDSRRSGSNVMGSGPLFQYRNYQQQERLDLNAKDISVIVDTVCPSEKSQEEAVWGELDPHEIWDSETAAVKPIGEACVTILIKLIMDMYLQYGPSVTYVLVLQMLQQTLLNAEAAVRIRVFDLIYNLSLHSLMLSSTPDDAFFEKSEPAPVPERQLSRHLSREMSSPERMDARRLDTLQEEAESGTRSSNLEKEDPMLHMMPWVRSLLFDLMTILGQLDEKEVSVWSAAVACFFHLTTSNGEPMIGVLQNFPVSIISKALRICVHAGWSDEIYSHLLRLLVKLLCLPHTIGYEGRVVNTSRLSQCGGIEEILFHLRTTRSMVDASHLVQLIINHASYNTNCTPEALAPLLSHLLSASAMDVIVARCRHGEKGIADILHAALQNCIIEKSVLQDSPKKPMHQRYRSHSSFLSSETAVSIQPGVDPRGLESWTAIVTEIDELLSSKTQTPIASENAQRLGNPQEATTESWHVLKELMSSVLHEDRMLGIRWIRDYSLMHLEQSLQQEDRSQMSLLPDPPNGESDLEGEETNGPDCLRSIMYTWASHPDVQTGVEASCFVEELSCRLVTLSLPDDANAPLELPARTIVHRLGTTLFRTLHSGLRWIRLLPVTSRKRPLLTLSFQVCQIVHAPHIISDISAMPPIDGLTSMAGPFVYNDYIFGTGSIYIRLLRLAPIEFLQELISDLGQFCPQYHDEIGFHGRPGHKGEIKCSATNVPWTDTVSDIRAALVLLLLHRCSMDSKSKARLEGICISLRHDADLRVRYVASRHLLKYMMEQKSDVCRSALREFVATAQQNNNEQMVDNPYLQVEHILRSETRQERPLAD